MSEADLSRGNILELQSTRGLTEKFFTESLQRCGLTIYLCFRAEFPFHFCRRV